MNINIKIEVLRAEEKGLGFKRGRALLWYS